VTYKNKFMSLGKYLSSRVFFGQLAIALVILVVLTYLFMHWLTFTTDHGHEITVPNLAKLTEEQVEEKLNDLDLDYVLLDSTDFNSDYPQFSVVEQDPLPGAKVKEGRKVYIKINPSAYSAVRLPNLVNKTYREVVLTLKALGLDEGTVTYVPNLGKDMVQELRLNGRNLKIGDRVMKSSKIDIVLGDGLESYVEEVDSTAIPTEEVPANEQ
jgi:beta-lactam-binding protein with PASTA domain